MSSLSSGSTMVATLVRVGVAGAWCLLRASPGKDERQTHQRGAAPHSLGRSRPAGHVEQQHDRPAGTAGRVQRDGNRSRTRNRRNGFRNIGNCCGRNGTATPASTTSSGGNGARIPTGPRSLSTRRMANSPSRRRRRNGPGSGDCVHDGGSDREPVPPPASWLDLNSFDRCITRSLPGAMMPGFYGHYYEILQTPDHVAIRIEHIHDVRFVPLRGGPHLRDGIRQWLGDSRGRWEGNTSVVETTNFNDKVRDRAATVFGAGADLRRSSGLGVLTATLLIIGSR